MTVGPQGAATTWHLPKALLTHKSPFFAAALNGSFAEAKMNSVTMPDDDPNIFRLWVQWLFVGNITCQISGIEDINNVLVKAWILGNKLGCHNFQNEAMIGLLLSQSPKLKDHVIEPSTLRAAYEGSAPGSVLRRWAIDSFLFGIRKNREGKGWTRQRINLWVSEAKDIEGFSQDYMEASVECSLEGEPANPYYKASRYTQ